MRFHLFPFRTEKLSSLTPMVLRFSRGRVGSRLFKVRSLDLTFFYAPFRAPALQLPEKQIIRNGLAAMAAKKIGKIFRDLPERAIRPIRIRGALYCGCRFLPFAIGGVLIAGALSTARLSFYPLFNLQLSQCAPVLPDHPVLSKQ